MDTYIIRTENETVITNEVKIRENYCWVEELSALYRIIEMDSDLQPDAILSKNKCHIHNLCKVGFFENAEKAFSVVSYNIAKMTEAMKQIEELEKEKIDKEEVVSKTELSSIPKTYMACYLFNYFGGDTIEDKVIDGANIDVAIRPYKNGKLIQFYKEEETFAYFRVPSRIIKGGRKETIYFSDLVKVSYDKDNCYKLVLNKDLIKLVCDYFGWDKIEIEVEEVNLSYRKSEYMSSIYFCGRKIAEDFMRRHAEDFAIKDNENAQCPAFGWIKE